MIRQASGHRWCRLVAPFRRLRQCTVRPDEVVHGEVQAERGLMVAPFLAESVCQPGKSAILHPHRKVVPLNVARANPVRVRDAATGVLDRADGFYGPDRPVSCDTEGGYLRISNLRKNSFKPVLVRAGLPDIRLYDLAAHLRHAVAPGRPAG
jgi:hypothetical protein